tara:strand:+ start:982 stop:1194 length:213 start_codon:yes stop_codon:yes gene_type:complete
MGNEKLISKANLLKDLSCIECTRRWLNKHDGLSNPIDDINICFDNQLISLELKERLISELAQIREESKSR